MKNQPLLIVALSVLVLVLWVQGRQTVANVEQLRSEQQAALVETDAPSQQRRTEAIEADALPASPPLAAASELATMQERIAELERDLSEVVEALNTAIGRLNQNSVAAERALQPAWGAAQAVGDPDTLTAGDQRTAWAPASADGGTEWLQLGYESAVEVAQIRVRETCGAGSIAKVAAVLEGGREVVIWQGRHEASPGIVDAPFNAPAGLTARGVKVYLDTARVPGWNEIDAVELIGRDGTRQWAKTSAASSSYGESSRVLADSLNTTILSLDSSSSELFDR